MTCLVKLDEYNNAEEPARELLKRLGWTYLPCEVLSPEREDERNIFWMRVGGRICN